MRDLNNEYQDTESRKYAYDFDYRMHDYMLKTFSVFFNGRRSALEMGCYKGEFTKKLAGIFSELTVVEGSKDLILEAKNNVNKSHVEFKQSYFESVSFGKKFDSVFLIHTLEHLDRQVEVLKKVNNWLADDGLFFIATPNANALSRQIAVHMNLIGYNDAVTEGEKAHGHTITYSLDRLRAHALEAGFEIVSSGGIFVKPMANFQLDSALEKKVIGEEYLEACYQLGRVYPDLCSSIYLVCRKKQIQ